MELTSQEYTQLYNDPPPSRADYSNDAEYNSAVWARYARLRAARAAHSAR